jgi:DNA-binding beta-propeller fold protein YncE
VTNKVVGEIKGLPANHGAQVLRMERGSMSASKEQHAGCVDAKTLSLIKSIPLTGRPNNISVAKDGKKLYVAIATVPGAVEVIDTAT